MESIKSIGNYKILKFKFIPLLHYCLSLRHSPRILNPGRKKKKLIARGAVWDPAGPELRYPGDFFHLPTHLLAYTLVMVLVSPSVVSGEMNLNTFFNPFPLQKGLKDDLLLMLAAAAAAWQGLAWMDGWLICILYTHPGDEKNAVSLHSSPHGSGRADSECNPWGGWWWWIFISAN